MAMGSLLLYPPWTPPIPSYLSSCCFPIPPFPTPSLSPILTQISGPVCMVICDVIVWQEMAIFGVFHRKAFRNHATASSAPFCPFLLFFTTCFLSWAPSYSNSPICPFVNCLELLFCLQNHTIQIHRETNIIISCHILILTHTDSIHL